MAIAICLIRDDAHVVEAGICGEPGKGVCSLVVKSGDYKNVDKENVIKYCDIYNKNGKKTVQASQPAKVYGLRCS